MIRRPRSRLLLLATLTLMLATSATTLIPAAESAAPQETGPQVTSMRGGSTLDPTEERRLRFLFWGYTAFWLLLAVYVVSVSVRLRGVQRELERMRQRLERSSAGGAR